MTKNKPGTVLDALVDTLAATLHRAANAHGFFGPYKKAFDRAASADHGTMQPDLRAPTTSAEKTIGDQVKFDKDMMGRSGTTKSSLRPK